MDEAGTWHGGRLSPGDFALDGDPPPLAQKGAELPPQFLAHFYCGQTAGCIKMPFGTYVGLSPGDFVLYGDPVPSPKRGRSPQIFSPCLLWPNGWMHQDASWHGGRPQPGDFLLDGDPALLPQKGAEPPPQFSVHFYYGQTAGCIKMPFGTDVGLSAGDFVLDGDPALPPKKECGARGRTEPPNFQPVYCGQTAGCIEMPLGVEVGLSPVDFVLDGDPAPTPKGAEPHPIFGPRLL